MPSKKRQSVEAEERRREQNRQAQRKFREKRKAEEGRHIRQHNKTPGNNPQWQTITRDAQMLGPPASSPAGGVGSLPCPPSQDPDEGSVFAFLNSTGLGTMDQDLELMSLGVTSIPQVVKPHALGTMPLDQFLQELPCESSSPAGIVTSSADRSLRHVNGSVESPTISPIKNAVQRGNSKIVRLLLEYGADVKCKRGEEGGVTPLMHAAIENFEEVADVLLVRGAFIHQVDDHGRSALHWAVLQGHNGMLKKLLKHCAGIAAPVDGRTKSGKTALEIAIDMGCDTAVELLLEHGALAI